MLSGYADGHDFTPHLDVAGEKSRRLIAIEGTNQPDTIETPRTMTAKRMFLREHPEWSVVEGGGRPDDPQSRYARQAKTARQD